MGLKAEWDDLNNECKAQTHTRERLAETREQLNNWNQPSLNFAVWPWRRMKLLTMIVRIQCRQLKDNKEDEIKYSPLEAR